MNQIVILWLLIFALFNSVFGQDFRFADPKTDKWMGDDKMIHAFGSYVLTDALKIVKKDEKKAASYAFMLGYLWEIKDGLMYKKYGGFSIKDMAANTIGIGLNLLAHKIIKGKHARQRESTRRELR